MSTSKQDNPFRALRERQGISQYELARRVGISKHAILRLEQGMYAQPLPAVVNYFLGYFPKLYSSPSRLIQEYENFQIETRQYNSRLIGDIHTDLTSLPVGTHPLTYLRENYGLNLTEFAKKLCIAQNVVFYFEKRSIHQHTVPDQLVHALWDADYTEAETDHLAEAYAGYREWITENRNFKLVPSSGTPNVTTSEPDPKVVSSVSESANV